MNKDNYEKIRAKYWLNVTHHLDPKILRTDRIPLLRKGSFKQDDEFLYIKTKIGEKTYPMKKVSWIVPLIKIGDSFEEIRDFE